MAEKAYKYRIYPNDEQRKQIAKTFGCNRFVYNYYLDTRIKAYEANKTTFTYYDCAKDLVRLKTEHEWLRKRIPPLYNHHFEIWIMPLKVFLKNVVDIPNSKVRKHMNFLINLNV